MAYVAVVMIVSALVVPIKEAGLRNCSNDVEVAPCSPLGTIKLYPAAAES